MTDAEQKIRTELNIPAGASQVVILSMDAHMDWDWRLNFQNFVFEGDASQKPIQKSLKPSTLLSTIEKRDSLFPILRRVQKGHCSSHPHGIFPVLFPLEGSAQLFLQETVSFSNLLLKLF